MCNDLQLELKGLRLDMIDHLEPYEITAREISPFDEELISLVDIPLIRRKDEFIKLADKIKTHYNKHKRVR